MSPRGAVEGRREVRPAETRIVSGMVRHVVWIAPGGIVLGALYAGRRGAAGVAVGLLLALANFALAALIMSRAARISLAAIQAAALFGFLFRLAALGVALYVLRKVRALDFPSLGLALCLGHLVILSVEARFLTRAMSLAGE